MRVRDGNLDGRKRSKVMNIKSSQYPHFLAAASELEPPACGNALLTAEPSLKDGDFDLG